MLARKPLYTIFTLLLGFSLQGQVKDTMAVFFDANLEPVKKKQAVYVGAAIKWTDGWKVLVYTDSLKLIMRGSYTDHTCKVKNGPFVYYNGKDRRLLSGSYIANKRVGLWQTWHPNGQTKDSVQFMDDLLQGPAYSFYSNGQMESDGWYRMGLLDSVWTWFHENSQKATIELYRGGKLADLQCFDTVGLSTGSTCAVAREPAIRGYYGGLLKYVADSIRMPARIPENEEGFIRVRFTVRRDGTVTEPEILSSVPNPFRQEILRTIKSIPGWYSAISHNRTVDHIFDFTVPYFERSRYLQPAPYIPPPNPVWAEY